MGGNGLDESRGAAEGVVALSSQQRALWARNEQCGSSGVKFCWRFVSALEKLVGSDVEVPEIQGHEGHEPNAVADFTNAHALAAQGVAEEELRVTSTTSQPNVTPSLDGHGVVVQGVLRLWQPVGKRPNRVGVQNRGRTLSESFMRAFVVVFIDEAIEALLLLEQRLGRRSRRFLFERQVHALMASVLLGMCRLDAFGQIPSRNHQTDSRLRPASPREAKGTPLSVRNALGRPNSRNVSSNTFRVGSVSVLSSPSQVSRNRLSGR